MEELLKLIKDDKDVWVGLKDSETAKRFLEDVEKEGFTFGDGVKPTERPRDNVYALKKNKTLSFVGSVGHIRYFQASDERLIKIDYAEYLKQK